MEEDYKGFVSSLKILCLRSLDRKLQQVDDEVHNTPKSILRKDTYPMTLDVIMDRHDRHKREKLFRWGCLTIMEYSDDYLTKSTTRPLNATDGLKKSICRHQKGFQVSSS